MKRDGGRTDDESELLKVSCIARVLDGLESTSQEVPRVVSVILVDDDLDRNDEHSSGLGRRWGLTRLIDSEIKRQDSPMLIAVSCLSPVKTQILIPACWSV